MDVRQPVVWSDRSNQYGSGLVLMGHTVVMSLREPDLDPRIFFLRL